MNIDSVKKLIASLEAAGELTIKERIYLYSMKEHMALKEQNAALAAENAGMKSKLMYWDAEDPEQPYDSPLDIAQECEMVYGDEFSVQVAARLPNLTYRVIGVTPSRLEIELVEDALPETPATDAFLASLRAEGGEALPRIQERDIKALLRFNETCEDGEGYDIGEAAMNRLVEIGLCRKGTLRVCHITPFGQWVIDAQEGEIDLTPLRTESDVNADFSAHIAQLRSQPAPSPETAAIGRQFEQVKGVQS